MQTATLIIAVLLAVIIILLIVLLIRTRRLAQPQILLEDVEEETPIIATVATVATVPISRYPLFDLHRQPPGILNIPPPPSYPVYFNHPNGGRLGK